MWALLVATEEDVSSVLLWFVDEELIALELITVLDEVDATAAPVVLLCRFIDFRSLAMVRMTFGSDNLVSRLPDWHKKLYLVLAWASVLGDVREIPLALFSQ